MDDVKLETATLAHVDDSYYYGFSPSGRPVHTAKLRCPASLADQPRLPVAAFGVYASPVCSAGTGESGARARLAFRICWRGALKSVVTSL
jgi:hypothetical protein